MKPMSQLLEEGAEIILQRGKCEYALENSLGQVCAVGALNIALTGASHWPPLFFDNGPYRNFLMSIGGELIEFNNSGPSPSTGAIPTAEEVADRMTELAKKYRNRGE